MLLMRKLRPKRKYCDLAKISELVGGRTKTGIPFPLTPNNITTLVISGVSIVISFKGEM